MRPQSKVSAGVPEKLAKPFGDGSSNKTFRANSGKKIKAKAVAVKERSEKVATRILGGPR
jgi:hypothetical protein